MLHNLLSTVPVTKEAIPFPINMMPSNANLAIKSTLSKEMILCPGVNQEPETNPLCNTQDVPYLHNIEILQKLL